VARLESTTAASRLMSRAQDFCRFTRLPIQEGIIVNKTYLLALLVFSGSATAAPVTYTLDPDHTHPSFEVDHFGGVSIWRGNFKNTTGTVEIDTAAKRGTVRVIIDMASIDFAHDKLNAEVTGSDFLDVAKYPTAEYTGKFVAFANNDPKTISGELTLHGVTRPVTLTVNTFKCFENPIIKRHVCGADASGTFNRADFGVNYGQQFGFNQDVLLRIQVEGIKAN
jgi:polyisoprenoid-binding protein YceI